MKINKYILGLAAVVITGFSSCNTDVEGETYSADPTLQSITFDAATQTINVSADKSEASTVVRITRGVSAGEANVNFTAEASEDGIFSNDANGVVKFAAGQNSAVINVKAENLEKEQSYTYTITLDEAVKNTLDTIANPKQNLKYVIKVTREGDWSDWKKWNSAGTGNFVYGGHFSALSGDDPDLPLTCRQNLLNPSKYQLKIQHWGYNVDLVMDYDSSTGVVKVASESFTGASSSTYGDIYVMDYNDWLVKYKGGSASDNYNGSFDTEKGIITLCTVYIDYVDPTDPWGAGWESFYLDGYVRKDLSSALEYVGVLTNADNEVKVMANLTLGADAETVKALIVSADDDAQAVADALAAGDVEGMDVTAGTIQVPMPEGATGKLQLVVAVISDGAVGSVSSVFFEYYGGGKNPWQSLGKGYLTDNFFITNYYKDQETEEVWTPQTYEVEILENTDEPGMYRIVNAFEGAVKLIYGENYTYYYEPSNMEVNATDPEGVYFSGQPIGYANQTISSYGGYLLSTGDYTLEQLKGDGSLGTLKNGEITLPKFQFIDANNHEYYYQGVRSTSSGLRYAGWMDDGIEFKITLPSAASSVKAKLASKARATDFELRLNGNFAKEVNKHNATVKIKKAGKSVKKLVKPSKQIVSFRK